MNDQYLILIQKLADKLGTTAELLWSVLLKQAPIYAISEFLGLCVLLAITFFWYKVVKQKTTKIDKNDRYGDPVWNNDFGVFCAWAGVFGLLFVTAVVASFTIHTVITAIFNPEYWALMKILRR